MNNKFIYLIILFSLFAAASHAQGNLVYVDKQGVLRWTKDRQEASFFGVNYTVPFAYGYRSHKALGADLKTAIDEDVRQMARLGLDAFRVHIWDVEISDSLGNLIVNDHLDLFDYLVQRLKAHNIRIIITPIAFWGDGYPEKDIRTNGFSYVYGKGNAVVLEPAIRAQENYLGQLLRHVNPYTHLSYKEDPDIIAAEINNEPHHSGPKEKTTEYINRLASAIRGTGWTKPVFYNISESPAYADAVAAAKVDGHSFQWYPTGLVAGHEQKGNLLPNVDVYAIPFIDTIPAFRNRARMVYEFDAGDVLQSYMYPAMARSFRAAGFQWATQFAYDPTATAFANTEYQTHYLNLLYTPGKAISLMIAARAFHLLPRGKSYGAYPADTLFGPFRVSYADQLSEMNTRTEFYYSNTTGTRPLDANTLQHVAGVGSSPVVSYTGTGAYFLDLVRPGLWRLEVMPDAIRLHDPFEKASLQKTVTQLQSTSQHFTLHLPGLGNEFAVNDMVANGGQTAVGGSFSVVPGIYYLQVPGTKFAAADIHEDILFPINNNGTPVLRHEPLPEYASGHMINIDAAIAGIDTSARVWVELRHSAGKWLNLPMQPQPGNIWRAELAAEAAAPGLIEYRIIVQSKGNYTSFPGGFAGDPYAWDNVHNERYESRIVDASAPLVLFDAERDRNRLTLMNPDWRTNSFSFITTDRPKELALTISRQASAAPAAQVFFGDQLSGRTIVGGKLLVRAKATTATKLKLVLVTSDAAAASATIEVGTDWHDIEIPLGRLQPGPFLLLPRPFPGFQPLWFSNNGRFNPAHIEKLQLMGTSDGQAGAVSIASVLLVR